MKNIISIILVALFFNACEYDKKIIPSGKIVKIGILAPLSGKAKKLGQQSLLGLQAANEMKKYLENGDEIIFEIFDTKSDIKSTKIAFDNLIKSDVKLIISFMGSSGMLEMKNIFNKHKLPIITTLATDDNLADINGYIAQVCIDNNTQVLVASHYIKDEKFINNVGVIYDKDSIYSSSLATKFEEYFKLLGGKVEFIIDIGQPIGLKKFQEIDKKNIKILFNTTDSILSTKVFKIINEQNDDFKVLATDGLLSGALDLSKENLILFNGTYVVEHYAHNVNKNEERKRLEKLLDENKYKYSSFTFLAYDGYQLLTYALNNCTSYNPKCINPILHNSDVIKGVSGNFSMIDAKAKREVYIDKISNSKLNKEIIVY